MTTAIIDSSGGKPERIYIPERLKRVRAGAYRTYDSTYWIWRVVPGHWTILKPTDGSPSFGEKSICRCDTKMGCEVALTRLRMLDIGETTIAEVQHDTRNWVKTWY